MKRLPENLVRIIRCSCHFAGSIKPSPVSSKHKPSSETSSIEPPKESSSVAKTAKAFTFRELATATKNFRSDCLLGEGGFGRVYKGKLENGQVHTKIANIQTFYVGKICTFIFSNQWLTYFPVCMISLLLSSN